MFSYRYGESEPGPRRWMYKDLADVHRRELVAVRAPGGWRNRGRAIAS